MDSDLLSTLTALTTNATSTLRYPREPSDIFIERDTDSFLGVRVTSLRAIDVSDVIFKRPRPTVGPGKLMRMLVGLGASYVVRSPAEFSAALADFCGCVKVNADAIESSTSSGNMVTVHRASHHRLPIVVRVDRRKGANFLLVDTIIPCTLSLHRKSVLLTVSLNGIQLFGSEIAIVDGHVHTSTCYHKRERAGRAFQAAADGNLDNLQYALQPTGWRLWLRGGCGDSTEEIISNVGGRRGGSG